MKAKGILMMVMVACVMWFNLREAQAFYNPSTGRWLSRDPIAEHGGKADYMFGSNDSVNRWDLAGLKDFVHRFNIHETPWDESSFVPLTGELQVTVSGTEINPIAIIGFKLIRPQTEENKRQWASAGYSGRGRKEFWSSDGWRWPNLAALFRPKSPRYGGVDPGKGVDDDFGAVVVKRSGSSRAPMVSGDWVNDNGVRALTQTSHAAHIRNGFVSMPHCMLAPLEVWFIYADLGGFAPENGWPSEFNGTAFSYFKIDWNTDFNGESAPKFSSPTPPPATHINWEAWRKAGAPERLFDSN